MPAISIILPVYNGEDTIETTVKTLLNQSFADFEICVCIDGSKDNTEKIISAFNDPRIRIFKNEHNMGLGRTLNRLVISTNAESRYIAMAEQDDYYYPDRLKLQFEFMESHTNVGLVSGIAEHFDGEKVTFLFPGLLANGQNYPMNLKENFLLHYCYQLKVANSCMMFRKSVHFDNGLYFSTHYPSISVDWSYILRFSLIGRIEGLPIPLVKLDRRPNRTSLTTKKSLQFKTARQLISNFYFENKNLISSKNKKTAFTTEYLIELSHMSYFKRVIAFPLYFIQNPTDTRWYYFFKKHVLRLKKNETN